MTLRIDASEVAVSLPERPGRIVSLVPSVTETLVLLGLAPALVGRTDFCIHPTQLINICPPIGGTKNPRLDDIIALAPDLVLANREENRESDVRRLRQNGLVVWVDHPVTLEDSVEQVRRLAGLGADENRAESVLTKMLDALAHARHPRLKRPLRCFLAVWKDPWMTIGRDTYAHHLLEAVGLVNVFADESGHYPRIELDELARREPEIVLLPDEPYRFTAADAEAVRAGELSESWAVRRGQVHLIDGRLPFWHGPRLGEALGELGRIAAAAGGSFS